MRLDSRWMLAVALALLAPGVADAQIYTCTADDGTRIFSDERCGPDAKVVPGISTGQRKASPRRPMTRKSNEELAELERRCDDGDVVACRDWTFGGGTQLLREQEREAEAACEQGSLTACEQRWCRDGVNERCRTLVLQTAKLSGESWYLRDPDGNGRASGDGATLYDIRCVPREARRHRDITVACVSRPGPNRCYVARPEDGAARLDLTAAKHCAAL